MAHDAVDYTTNKIYFRYPTHSLKPESPIGSFEGHLSYDFKSRFRARMDGNFWFGGSTRLTPVIESPKMSENAQCRVLKLDPRDNVLVALTDSCENEKISFADESYLLLSNVFAKHKFFTRDVAAGAAVIMYGVLVGTAVENLRRGELLTTRNVCHASFPFHEKEDGPRWTNPTSRLGERKRSSAKSPRS